MNHTTPCLVCLAILTYALPAIAEDWEITAELSAPEAIQAAAADREFVYAIASRQIAKYDRASGNGPAKHLNSGFLWNGSLSRTLGASDRREKTVLLCAHSNYPRIPEESEIKILDPDSMRLSTFRDFKDYGGSLTWVVYHGDHWWCNFARYGGDNADTFFVRFDDGWRETGRWTYPKIVIDQLGRYSLSGGIWYNRELLVTGHDRPQFYRLCLPESGQVLEYIGKQSVPFTGQGFAEDHGAEGLVGISRAKRRVIFVRALKR